jgi:SpoVK/Ycf46/Vps4 family AAA+-type ATPase
LVYFIQGLHTSEIGKGNGDFKHTVIYGPPGTGKTEIAKIIGKMYSKLGILKNNVFKKATRNDLVAGYLGQTAIKTKNLLLDCLGGVLFIDEAYSLSNADHLDSFSQECIDTLCEALSDHKDELMVIIAGYEDELEKHFFQSNPGLNSRFVWRFKVDSYTPAELAEIFRKKVGDAGWKLAEEGVANARWFEKHKKSFLHFGRDMEILFFYTKIRHSRRVFGKSADTQGNAHRTITDEDIEKGLALFLENAKRPDETYRRMMESMYI